MSVPATYKLLQKVSKLLEENNLSEARIVCKKICKIDKNNPDAWLQLATICARIGTIGEAVSNARRAVSLNSSYAKAHFVLGNLLGSEGNLEQARYSLEQAVQVEPGYAEAWHTLGGILGMQGQYARAEECCQKTITLQPDTAAAYTNLANAQAAQGKHEEAIVSLRNALRLEPGDEKNYYQLGRIFRHLGRRQDAINSYLDAIRYKPDLADAYSELGSIYLANGNVSQAEPYYRKSIDLKPNQANTYIGLVSCCMALDKFDDALSFCNIALGLQPDLSQVLYTRGVLLTAKSETEAAIADFQLALKAKPEDVRLYSRLAEAYCQLGKHAEASGCYRRILEIDPENTEAGYLLAAVGDAPEPAKSPPDYVAETFDKLAESFEHHLTDLLEYHIPQKLVDMVKIKLPANSQDLAVLDLGCGTGLCGPLVREFSATLVGVDLSPKMIAKTREKSVYDRLVVGELVQELQSAHAAYDLILAADVFVYIGDLTEVFQACKPALKDGGLFAFSSETLDQDGTYVLMPSGRYAHTTSYIENLAASAGLQILDTERAVIRKEGGKPANGRIFVLQKPA